MRRKTPLLLVASLCLPAACSAPSPPDPEQPPTPKAAADVRGSAAGAAVDAPRPQAAGKTRAPDTASP